MFWLLLDNVLLLVSYLLTSCRYEYISPETLKAARDAGEILYEGSDRDETGRKIDVFFTRNNLIDRKEPSLFMSDGDLSVVCQMTFNR